MKSIAATTLICSLLAATEAFVVPNNGLATATTTISPASTQLFESTLSAEEGDAASDEDAPANPDYPNLPEVKGDFDWDAKFGGDDDWITENVPGKIVLDEITLAKQVTALNNLEDTYRKQRAKGRSTTTRSPGGSETPNSSTVDSPCSFWWSVSSRSPLRATAFPDSAKKCFESSGSLDSIKNNHYYYAL